MALIQALILLAIILTLGFLFTHRVLTRIVFIGLLDITVAGIILCAGLKIAAFVYLVISLFTIALIFTLGTKVINMSHTERSHCGFLPKVIFSVVFVLIELGLVIVLTHGNADYSSLGNLDALNFTDYTMNKSMFFIYSLTAIAASIVVFVSVELLRKRDLEC